MNERLSVLIGYLKQTPAGLAVGAVIGFVFVELDLATLVSFWGDRRFFIVLGALAVAAVWPLRFVKPVSAAIAGALMIVWLLVCFTPITRGFVRGLDVSVSPEEADAVVVLGSRLQEDGGFTATSLARLVRALELVAQGYTDTIVVTEIPGIPPHLEAARALATQLDIDADLRAVGPVTNTYEEALKISEACERDGVCKVLLVTSPTHMRRAAATFETAGLDVVPVSCPETNFDIESLVRPTERLRAFGAALHERLGYVVYVRKGRIHPIPSP